MSILIPDETAIRAAAQHLADGGLVAFPTETVYGLGARADDDRAVAGIFAAKGRPAEHPLIVHLARARDAEVFASELSVDARRLMAAFWPGPLTVIVPRRPGVAQASAGGQNSIGLRLPSHPVAQALLQACADLGVPGLAAPSANRFGRVSPTTADHVAKEFGQALWVLDGGPCDVGIESAIVDCTGAQPGLLRPGQLTAESLHAALGRPLAQPTAASPRASGTLESHYAPSLPVRLWGSGELAAALQEWVQAGQGGLAVYSRTPVLTPAGMSPPGGRRLLSKLMPATPEAVARELFSVLRELEVADVQAIWVEQPPADPAWDGVRDRLKRAAA